MAARFSPSGLILASLSVVLCAAAPTPAIVVNGDPGDYVVTPPSEFDMVAYTNAVGGSGGVLVSPWFVLTAGHVTDFGTTGKWFSFDLPGGAETYNWDPAVIRHPTADLALVRLDRNTGMAGYELYTALDEATQTGTLAGYGMSGTGTSVDAGGDPAYPRGTLRGGTNRIDAAVFDTGTFMLRTDFDANGSDVMIGLGDSGGPIFLADGAALKLAGIHSFVDNADPDHWPLWGDTGLSVRVSKYADWINANIPGLGDFNDDDAIDVLDIDLLTGEIAAGGSNLWPYDLSADDLVNAGDTDLLVSDILGTFHGDTDLDGDVDVFDLATFGNHYRQTGVGWGQGDFNGDGAVDVFDLAIFANNYNRGVTGAGQSFVPEPAVAALLAAGLAALPRRRRRR